MCTAKFDIFLFNQISLVKFWKKRTGFNLSTWFDEIWPIKTKMPTCEEKLRK